MDQNIRKLLIVDDEPEIRETMLDILSAEGIECLQAANASEGLAIIKQGGVTAIISDINMPGESGIDFLTSIRSLGLETPLVFITAADNKENMKKAVQLGAFDFLAKPYHPENLISVAHKVLEAGAQIQKQDANSSDQKRVSLLRVVNSKKTN